MRVCYFGTYRASYVRNRLMIDRLLQQGVEVVECHESLWKGITDRAEIASGGWTKPGFWWRVITTYIRLLFRYKEIGYYDILLVGYPGQLDIFLAWLLSRLRGKPLVWDVLMSIYLIACERGIQHTNPFSVWLIHQVEHLVCHLPDLLLMDTPEYALWFQENYHISPERINLVPLGADDRVFIPMTDSRVNDGVFRCVYYGTFIPNHGVQVIIETARILSDYTDIQFDVIGEGPYKEKVMDLAQKYNLVNVQFYGWMDEAVIVQHMAKADICLGTFGITPQALLTMQNKIHEGMAMAKPVVNGDSPVMRSTLQHGKNIFLCERENPQALADAILALRENPELRAFLAQQVYQTYLENFSMEKLGKQLKHCLAREMTRRK